MKIKNKSKREKLREDILSKHLLDTQELFDTAIVLFDKKRRIKEKMSEKPAKYQSFCKICKISEVS